MFTKDFFKDRLILFLGALTFALTALNVLFILLSVNFNQTKLIFRHWLINGNSQFYNASPSYFYTFIVLALITLVTSWVISYKVYDSFKPAAYFAFLLAQIVLLAGFLISETLLRL